MKEYGLLGFPLGHSFSQRFFREKFAREGIDADYLNFEIADIGELRDILEKHPQLCGLNVTIPHKEKVIALLDEVDPDAQSIGAVNVISLTPRPPQKGGSRLVGYNTDWVGFSESIRPLLKPHHQKALVLGTGGASKAVVHALRKLGIQPTYVSRRAAPSPSAPSLLGRAGGEAVGDEALTYSDLTAALMQEYTVVVNCTPCGMFPRVDECPDIPYEGLDSRHLLYDLTYNPETTLFMKKGAAQGAQTQNGWEMLKGQAQAAWRIWNE